MNCKIKEIPEAKPRMGAYIESCDSCGGDHDALPFSLDLDATHFRCPATKSRVAMTAQATIIHRSLQGDLEI